MKTDLFDREAINKIMVSQFEPIRPMKKMQNIGKKDGIDRILT